MEMSMETVAEDTTNSNSSVANATEVFCIPDGVQIFYINPEGYVSAPSDPTSLKIFKFEDQQPEASAVSQPPAFLQVGDWIYPLKPGTSAALQPTYGAYILLDVTAAIQGSYVGLVLPGKATKERKKFEELMQSLTMMCHEEELPEEILATEEVTPEAPREQEPAGDQAETLTTSGKISKNLITATECISRAVDIGAEKAGVLISYESTKLTGRLQPGAPINVDPKVQKGIQYVRTGSHVAVKVSSYITTKLGQATEALAKEAAPHIVRRVEKLIPKSIMSTSSDGNSKLDGVVEVAATGIKGFNTVFLGLETAAKNLGKSLANETVNVVSHKYGQDAGQLAENTIYSVGNIALTVSNLDSLGTKGVAQQTVKDTGKAVLKDVADKRKP